MICLDCKGSGVLTTKHKGVSYFNENHYCNSCDGDCVVSLFKLFKIKLHGVER